MLRAYAGLLVDGFDDNGVCLSRGLNQKTGIWLICSLFVLVLHLEPPCVSQKMGDKRNWSIVTGKWVLEKASLHMYRARIDVSANRNGKVRGKCEWKNGDGGR